MSSIKGPGGPRMPPVPTEAPATQPTERATGGSFAEKVAEVRAKNAAEAVGGVNRVGPTTASVIDALAAGTIAWEAAVEQLVDIAMDRGGVPAVFRASVAERMRRLVATDPRVREALRSAGVNLTSRE